jgi:hypothetical protein
MRLEDRFPAEAGPQHCSCRSEHPEGRGHQSRVRTAKGSARRAGSELPPPWLVRRDARFWHHVQVRINRYLNNILEQNHRAVKRRCSTLHEFGSVPAAPVAPVAITRIELAHRIRKRQLRLGLARVATRYSPPGIRRCSAPDRAKYYPNPGRVRRLPVSATDPRCVVHRKLVPIGETRAERRRTEGEFA